MLVMEQQQQKQQQRQQCWQLCVQQGCRNRQCLPGGIEELNHKLVHCLGVGFLLGRLLIDKHVATEDCSMQESEDTPLTSGMYTIGCSTCRLQQAYVQSRSCKGM